MRRRDVTANLMVYGPAFVWVVFALLRYGPTGGYLKVLGLAMVVAFGLVGVMAVFVAYFPATVERAGFKRLGAWLRTW